MAKRKQKGADMPQVAEPESRIRHARIELSEEDYEKTRRVAKANGLSLSAYIRMAVLQRTRQDLAQIEGGSK